MDIHTDRLSMVVELRKRGRKRGRQKSGRPSENEKERKRRRERGGVNSVGWGDNLRL